MAKVKICDGRTVLYQWDTGVQLEMCGCSNVTECHFVTSEGVIKRDVVDNICDVPDAALKQAGKLIVYAFSRTEDEGTTRHEFRLAVYSRPKPADYIDPPDEYDNLSELAKRIAPLIPGGGGDPITPEQIQQAVDHYLTENPVQIEETDPTVPGWAKAEQKPSYTAEEVGALPADTKIPEPYTLPIASADTLGGVKVGEGLQMDGDVLNVKEGEWDLIEKITIEEEDLKSVTRTEDPNGIPYNLSAVKVIARVYYPLTEIVAAAVRFRDKNDTELGYITSRIPKSTLTEPQYKSTGVYQAKPVSGLYEFTSMTGAQGELMTVNAPINGSGQTIPTNKKIAKIAFLRWDSKTIPVGTQIEIWGVQA